MNDRQEFEGPAGAKAGGPARGKRLAELEEVQPAALDSKSTEVTPDEARALIDNVLQSYGLDPEEATDAFGWRYLSLGSAQGSVGVIEWQPEEYHLVVRAAVVRLPPMDEPLCDFYRWLLELNHDGTLSARFSVHEDVVGVSVSRPIRGLDEVEVQDAIRTVMVVADSYDDWLQETLDRVQATAPLPVTELPKIRMRPKDTETVSVVLGFCDPHGRDLFRYMMERWQRLGHVVAPGTSGIGLAIAVGDRQHRLAAMRPGVGERSQLLILGWEGLRELGAWAPLVIDGYQTAVEGIAPLQITESTAHIEVTEAFDRAKAQALLGAMHALAQATRSTGAE
jgi:hypothetical protein